MRLTYDERIDIAYLYFTEPNQGVKGYTAALSRHGKPTVEGFVFDLDDEGKVRGIEFLRAKQTLPAEVLAKAGRPDG